MHKIIDCKYPCCLAVYSVYLDWQVAYTRPQHVFLSPEIKKMSLFICLHFTPQFFVPTNLHQLYQSLFCSSQLILLLSSHSLIRSQVVNTPKPEMETLPHSALYSEWIHVLLIGQSIVDFSLYPEADKLSMKETTRTSKSNKNHPRTDSQ